MTTSASHIGLCVRDLEASRRFYESVFGFRTAFGFTTADAATAQLLRLDPPPTVDIAYLWLDGLLLELLAFDRSEDASARVMNETGLTHLSFFVDDLSATMAAVDDHGGRVRHDTNVGSAVMVEDPDGQIIELVGPGGRFRTMRDGAIAALDS